MRFLLVLVSVLGSAAFAGPTDAEAEAAARRVLSDPDYQVELPTGVPPPTERDVERRRENRGFRDSSTSGTRDPEVTGRSLAQFLWYLLIVVVLVALLLWAGREWMDVRQRNLRAPGPEAAKPVRAARAGPDLPDAAALAAAGRFAEAIHALLLVALHEVHRRAGSLAPAWTSREILYKVALPPDARTALEEIVRVVERSRFGGAAVDAAEYAACARHAEACRRALPEKAA
ncbi:MAG: DUF4129 domain-containing protein [Deltaproteobacteria bacterium]|nr:MAG: DUF4129 domain-containing protein [Deltaproteobacteria bacterium]